MDTAAHPAKSRFFSLRVLVLFVLLVAAFGYYLRYYNPLQRAGIQQVYDTLSVYDARLQNLDNTLSLHEKRIADMEEKMAATSSAAPGKPVAASAPAALPDVQEADEKRITALEKEISTLQSSSSPATAVTNEQLVYAVGLLSAFHRLSDKVIGGKPFAAELVSFEKFADKDETTEKQLAILLPYAESGIPTFAQLLASYDDALEQLNAYEAIPPAGASLWERFVYNIRHLVSIKRLDDQQKGTSADAIVGRAQAHLEREEIDGAITELKSLPPATKSIFSAWMDDAQITSEAPDIISTLEEQVMRKAFGIKATEPAVPQKK